MTKTILQLERFHSADHDAYRTIFKTKHGRVLYLALSLEEATYTIEDCFYIDRNQGRTG